MRLDFIVSGWFSAVVPTIEESTLELVRKHHLACEQLTEQQIADVIRQALLSGDIIKCVRQGHPHAQSVIYVPYAECERLRSKLHRHEQFLASQGLQLPEEEES